MNDIPNPYRPRAKPGISLGLRRLLTLTTLCWLALGVTILVTR